MDEIVEEVFHRACVSAGICDAIPQLPGFYVVVDESFRDWIACQECDQGEAGFVCCALDATPDVA